MAKNYYDALGVAKDASPEQIKKAYRKLAKKYHPDISKEDDAEARMQEINVAYDTLSNEEKKKQYDFELEHPEGFNPFGQGRQGHSGFQQNQYYHYGADDQQHDFSGFEDIFGRFGAGFGGSNYDYQRSQRQHNRSYQGEDQHASLDVDLDIAFHGATQNITLQIPTMNGYGEAEIQRKTLQVKIPKGMKDGQQIRLSGQGQSGINGGKNGDLYIEIHYINTDKVRVEDADIYLNVDITPWEAALGQAIEITVPAGNKVQVNLPKNTRTGQQLRLKGQGIPHKTPGNLYLILNIVNPPANSETEQAAYQAFAEAFSQFKPRQS
ncbi:MULTISPECIES: DnaJ C-terminal domain-containing protein [unclassified Acinetobacter]|uniref:DnaJ C-terminal domain-containing protein n=1 Tax=unclassified Acinetobacter TaxID=196816 RepID=UPI0029345AA0|nr:MULTISPECIES: DnaJ C-terminal domain-containing protein [unclassified Acinetobacter]WOE31189.1 DnaJ C-terminal domain-containing protein [Acinetobacter sp. SAAs470]WOE39385.1 DnaJ C-terminal domain-containing protein [Acinetobacter sp. SAAs474]